MAPRIRDCRWHREARDLGRSARQAGSHLAADSENQKIALHLPQGDFIMWAGPGEFVLQFLFGPNQLGLHVASIDDVGGGATARFDSKMAAR